MAKKYGLTPKWVWLNRILTFVAATVAWVFFRASSMRAAGDVLAAMVGLKGVSGEGILRVVPLLAAFIVGGPPLGEPAAQHLGDPAPSRSSATLCCSGSSLRPRCWP